MEIIQIKERVQEIFCDVLDNDLIVLTEKSTADDIDGWDSLAHIQLLDAIQKEFNIKFTAKEMLGWENVGELIECIHIKANK